MMDQLNLTANQFSTALSALSDVVGVEYDKIVRKTVLDLFANIIKRSPVDSGAYRASHMIANHAPSGDEGVQKPGGVGNLGSFWGGSRGWTWRIGDGTIYIFNNLPYAERIEDGWSGQAPQGVYAQALAEGSAILHNAIAALNVNGYFK